MSDQEQAQNGSTEIPIEDRTEPYNSDLASWFGGRKGENEAGGFITSAILIPASKYPHWPELNEPTKPEFWEYIEVCIPIAADEAEAKTFFGDKLDVFQILARTMSTRPGYPKAFKSDGTASEDQQAKLQTLIDEYTVGRKAGSGEAAKTKVEASGFRKMIEAYATKHGIDPAEVSIDAVMASIS